MQWAQWWGRSWIPPWTKLLKGPVVMSANGHALPRGRKLLDRIITMQVWDFQESASEPKHSQLPKPLVGSRAPGRTGKSSKVMAGVRGPHAVHSRLLWGVVSHRVYTAAIFSETKFLPQVLLLPTCSKCRRPAVVRSSYWTKALSRRRKQTWEVEPRAGDCGRCGSFSPSQASPEGVGIPLQPGRNLRGRWHQQEKLRSWQSFLSSPIPTNTLSHIHTHKHAHTHTLAFSNAWQVLQAKPDLGPDLLLEGSRKQCHDPGVRPEVKVWGLVSSHFAAVIVLRGSSNGEDLFWIQTLAEVLIQKKTDPECANCISQIHLGERFTNCGPWPIIQ